jgi:hypothetical protein
VTDHAVARLREKHAELLGEINMLLRRLAQLRADLAHVDGALRVLEPDIELERISPKRFEFRPRYFKRGALTRLCLDYIRQNAGRAIAVSEIMPVAIGDRNLTTAEYRRVEVVVYEALRKLAKRGTLRQEGRGAKSAVFVLGSL